MGYVPTPFMFALPASLWLQLDSHSVAAIAGETILKEGRHLKGFVVEGGTD
jgi:hypothetical protein